MKKIINTVFNSLTALFSILAILFLFLPFLNALTKTYEGGEQIIFSWIAFLIFGVLTTIFAGTNMLFINPENPIFSKKVLIITWVAPVVYLVIMLLGYLGISAYEAIKAA